MGLFHDWAPWEYSENGPHTYPRGTCSPVPEEGLVPKTGFPIKHGMRAMLSEVAEIMGCRWYQLCPPNHPVSLLNWDDMGRMLAEMPPNKQDSFREWLVPSMLPQPVHTVDESAMDAHCHLQLLQAREVRARTVPFNFATEPVPAWETAFSLWRVTVRYTLRLWWTPAFSRVIGSGLW